MAIRGGEQAVVSKLMVMMRSQLAGRLMEMSVARRGRLPSSPLCSFFRMSLILTSVCGS
jgi:hypothetical protein